MVNQLDPCQVQSCALVGFGLEQPFKFSQVSSLNSAAQPQNTRLRIRLSLASNWYFDTEAGKDEVLARRIGRNELLAIDAIFAIANAEEQYAQQPRDGNPAGLFATKIFSNAGKQDGLYWPAAEGEPASPLGRVEVFARDALSTPNESPTIDGYSFRILVAESDQVKRVKHYIVNRKMTGGFAVIASPVKYGDSGIMTFIINRDGVVYQRDLGPDTQKVAPSIAEYNPTDNWVPAE